MAIHITLRKDSHTSHFKNALLDLISTKNLSELVLCSGYIQEDLFGYSILQDDLLDALLTHPNSKSLKIKVVGGKFGDQKWEKSFKRFVDKIKSAGLNCDAFEAINKNWHAKVAIGKSQSDFIGAIIGSSNLTRPAYGHSYSRFNMECDVILINDSSGFSVTLPDTNIDDPLSAIQAIQNPEVDQPEIIERIHGLYDEVLNDTDLQSFEI